MSKRSKKLAKRQQVDLFKVGGTSPPTSDEEMWRLTGNPAYTVGLDPDASLEVTWYGTRVIALHVVGVADVGDERGFRFLGWTKGDYIVEAWQAGTDLATGNGASDHPARVRDVPKREVAQISPKWRVEHAPFLKVEPSRNCPACDQYWDLFYALINAAHDILEEYQSVVGRASDFMERRDD